MIAMLATDLGRLFRLEAIRRSALGLLIAATFLPVTGVLVVGLGVLTARLAMMHVALVGIAVGLWTGIDPTMLGLVACAVVAFAMAPLADRPGGLSGPMGLVMTLAMAVALLVLSISGVNANGAFSLLWGSVLATRWSDVVLLSVLAVLVLGWMARTHRDVALVLFDREIAACSGVHVRAVTVAALVLVSLSIGASVRLTGALLVDALTILPALTARALATSLRSMVLLAIVAGVVGNGAGFLLALELDQPLGPVLVIVSGLLTLTTYLKKGITHAPTTH